MVRRRSTVRFRNGAPGGFHISSVSIFTFGSDSLASAWDDLVRGGVRAWCGWLAWVRACRTAVVTVPGENRLVSSGAGVGRLGRGGEAGEGFAAVLARSGREPGGGAAGVV